MKKFVTEDRIKLVFNLAIVLMIVVSVATVMSGAGIVLSALAIIGCILLNELKKIVVELVTGKK